MIKSLVAPPTKGDFFSGPQKISPPDKFGPYIYNPLGENPV